MISKRTISSIFMMPTLKIPRDKLNKVGYINSYTDDVDKQYSYENSLYLLFKPKNIEEFREFLEGEYERTKQIIDEYDYTEGYVVIVYQLEGKWINDFNLIKEGKYSETSNLFKKLFPEKVNIFSQTNNKLKDSLQYMIFTKDNKLIDFWEDIIDTSLIVANDLEVWPTYDEVKETLNIKEIIENE
jgi:hypothetical protein